MGKTNISYVKTDPNHFFSMEKPILFTEWQEAPEIWDMIRSEVDRTGEKGKFILTDQLHHEKT